MLQARTFGLLVRVAGLAALMTAVAQAQTLPPVTITSVTVGNRPMGIAFSGVPVAQYSLHFIDFAVIANSGDNSVSVVLPSDPSSVVQVLTGIPGPFGVAACPVNNLGTPTSGPVANVLVTSPTDNSVWVLQFGYAAVGSVSGRILGKVQTGTQPYSVRCDSDNSGIVSNVGDGTLTVLDPSGLKVKATIAGVPGARGFRGFAGGDPLWVAGTDANVVTQVSLSTSKVLAQIPVSRPTAVVGGSTVVYVASAGNNSITAYDSTTLSQLNNVFQAVPSPQNFLFSALGAFVIGAQDSLWRFDSGLSSTGGGSIATVQGAGELAVYAPSGSPQVVFVTSANTNSVFLVRQAPAPPIPADFGVSNAASFAQSPFAPASLASAFASTGASQNAKATGVPLPTILGGVALKVGGSLTFDAPNNKWVYSPTGAVPAAILFVGPNQINFQMPPSTAPGSSVPCQVTKPDGATLLTTLSIAANAPGIFSVSQDGKLQGAVLNQDSSQNGVPQLITGAKPAARGSVIQIFATGAGDTNPRLDAGAAAPTSGGLVFTVAQPTVTIGGKTVQVQFSGLAPGFVGLWQINAVVPSDVTPGNAVTLTVAAGGQTSNTVTIAVQ